LKSSSGFRGGENGIDVVFPQMSTFRVALNSAANRNNKRTIKCDTKVVFIPLSKDIIDREESWMFGAR
jgi:hypothetical protein